jgi:hypothetical protein
MISILICLRVQNTVEYFDWKTVIYIYLCGKCRTQFMLSMEKSVTFTGACANEIIPSINRSFVYKAKEGRHVRIEYKIMFIFRLLPYVPISLVSFNYLILGCVYTRNRDLNIYLIRQKFW